MISSLSLRVVLAGVTAGVFISGRQCSKAGELVSKTDCAGFDSLGVRHLNFVSEFILKNLPETACTTQYYCLVRSRTCN